MVAPLLTLLSPLAGFLILSIFGHRLGRRFASVVGCGVVFIAFCSALLIARDVFFGHQVVSLPLFHWFSVGHFSFSFALLIDQLSGLMMLIITGVGFLIHLYSVGYMHDEKDFSRYFSHLNLFIFFMLILVLSDNYLGLFIVWEGFCLCSYLLIGYWFENAAYTRAAKKAFLMNRIGDLGFILGLLAMLFYFGSVEFRAVFSQATLLSSGHFGILIITVLLFVGATGKSAQIPLFTWLPDAMAGPTPVSALIHAATMVTAGIYMMARSHILYNLAPFTLNIVLWVGVATALVGALIATRQSDIKKVLAYSTVSQLGYMVAASGLGAYHIALFHMTTHAFFKALLFLGAGSIIHALSGEQDMFKMGGLRKVLPMTFVTFLVGALALVGFPPFAGFFSKDAILIAVGAHHPIAFYVLLFCSILTAWYVFRLLVLVFMGTYRGDAHAHESPAVMQIPLFILAIFSAISGLVFFQDITRHHSVSFELQLAAITVISLGLVYWLASHIYLKRFQSLIESPKTADSRFDLDTVYTWVFVKPVLGLSWVFSYVIDPLILDKSVFFIGKRVMDSGVYFRKIQSGKVGYYLMVMTVVIILVLGQLLCR